MSKKNRRREQPKSGQETRRNTYNKNIVSTKLEAELEAYVKNREADPSSHIGCSLCNHALFDHDSYGCLNCFPSVFCNQKELIVCVGNWKITLTDERIVAEKIAKR